MSTMAETVRPAPARPGVGPDREIVSRLRRAEGQLGGVRAMYEDGRCCVDLLDQLAAVGAAADAAALLILRDHIRVCLRDAVKSGDVDDTVDQLVAVIHRYVRRGGRQ